MGLRITGFFMGCFLAVLAFAQPKLEFEMKKPKKFEERKLGSEKMAEKKFNLKRHFFQNMYTHYNYYFNANNKIKDIVATAKTQHTEDYTRLLPFYNYSLDVTAKNGELDSVIQKCTAGILLHDLRNDWIDNLYLLIGRAYLLRKDYDSAAMTFQYINYAYSPKEKDGFDKVIGSNSNEGAGALSISTKEKTNIYKKVVELPPSRNESFLWQIRTFTERGEYIDAASLITTLRNDPLFPVRLKEELNEVEALNYYKQEMYDSSARYLSEAISLAEDKTEKARWYYLLGQMYQHTNQKDKAAEYFAKCASTTVDPVMEVYAHLSSVRLRKNDDPKVVQENIDEILKMARKEKYESYRDIIYYAAALSEIERNGYDKADEYLKKSILFNQENEKQRSMAFLLLADMNYDLKKYGNAGKFYDSVNTTPLDSLIAKKVDERKPGTKIIYDNERIIFAQDSLLTIAAMPENERNSYVKALAKRIRKEKGLKDLIDSSNTGLSVNAAQIGKGATSLFTSDNSDFYFSNRTMRTNGFQQFKQKWGARPNVDNWRRSAAIQVGITNPNAPVTDLASAAGTADVAATELNIETVYNPTDISFDALASNLPIEKDKADLSNKSINNAMLKKAKSLQNNIEDLPEAIKVYEALLARLEKGPEMEEVIFNLIYCYNKTGNQQQALAYRKRLETEFKGGPFVQKFSEVTDVSEKSNPAATALYKQIYNLFIEGQFDKAESEKRLADSMYKATYWTPQLLYIESVYYIKQRNDSVAIQKLTAIVNRFGASPLAEKSKTLIDVLSRRSQIENHLANLVITRDVDSAAKPIETIAIVPEVIVEKPAVDSIEDRSLSALINKMKIDKTPLKDTVTTKTTAITPTLATGKATITAPKDTAVPKPAIVKTPPAKDTTAKPAIVKTAPPKDTVKTKPVTVKNNAKDSVKTATVKTKPVKDTITAKSTIVKTTEPVKPTTTEPVKPANAPITVAGLPYAVDTLKPQMVAILLDKVDVVYLNECLNAFNRYNQQHVFSQKFELQKQKLNAVYSLVTINSADFTNAAKAMEYINLMKPIAATKVVPWLDQAKFSFILLSPDNYELLKQNPDMPGYLKVLRTAFPGKF